MRRVSEIRNNQLEYRKERDHSRDLVVDGY